MSAVITAVAGIGASAGGLEAFRALLSHLPADTGLGFVFVQHLDPTHRIDLKTSLAGMSSIPLKEAADSVRVEPNHLYVIQPDTALRIEDGILRTDPRVPMYSGAHLPIDLFLNSLAKQYRGRSIGVVLSGAGSDGAAGVKAVRAAGGVTFAQEPATAAFDSMPRAAIGTGCVDLILRPEAIAAELVKLARDRYFAKDESANKPGLFGIPGGPLTVAPLHDANGNDMARYPEKTLRRAIGRRLALRHISNLEGYCELIKSDPQERSALQQDLLMDGARFFRDPELFENLRTVVFPSLVRDTPANAAIRIWVAGCGTGEEPYSIGISLQEYLRESGRKFPVRIFATDVSATAIASARSGRYAETIAEDVGPRLLNLYFTKADAWYLISKNIREMCVFSRHDLSHDPPFPKLDLISCGDTPSLSGSIWDKVVARFHFALNPGGFLILRRPTRAKPGELFSAVDGAPGIYTKNEIPTGSRSPNFYAPGSAGHRARPVVRNFTDGFRPELDRTLSSRYGGTGVIVDENLKVLEIIGQPAPYIALGAGKMSFALLKLVPDTGLFVEISNLVREAAKSGKATNKSEILYEKGNGLPRELNIHVAPLAAARTSAFLILFEPAPDMPETEAYVSYEDGKSARLQQDLASVRQELLSAADDHHRANAENQSSVYEALSTNEELRSLNEELEAAKEVLQSFNEELTALNLELVTKNAGLTEGRDFARAIIGTAASPILVLDAELRIETANSSFYHLFHSSPDEVEGKAFFSVLKCDPNIPRLRAMLAGVLPDGNTIQDFEIEQDLPKAGRKVFVLNARQLGNVQKILLTLDDVTGLKKSSEVKLRESEERFTTLADATPFMIWTSGLNKGWTFVNRSFRDFAGVTLQQELGRGWLDAVHPEDLDRVWGLYSSSFDAHQEYHMEFRHRRADGEYRCLVSNGVPRVDSAGVFAGYIGSCVDITDLKSKLADDLAKEKLETVGTLAEGIVHDFNNLLGGILANSELALEQLATGSEPAEELHRIRAASLRGAEIVRQLMTYAGRESEVSESVSVSGIVADMLELLRVTVSKHVAVKTDLRGNLPPVQANPAEIRQIVMNLIANASEAIGEREETIRVATSRVTAGADSSAEAPSDLPTGDYVQLEVADTGRGMTPEVQARIFDPFFTTKSTGSHGHGLVVVKRIVQRLQGAIKVSSTPGRGTIFRIFLPCKVTETERIDVPETNSASDAPGAPQPAILFVDGEDLFRRTVAKLLQKKGFSVTQASDGSAALDIIRAHKDEIDLLLLDITLPEAISRQIYLEATGIKPGLPVIVTSARSEEAAASSLATEITTFLRKPFPIADLIEMIWKLLPPQGHQSGLANSSAAT